MTDASVHPSERVIKALDLAHELFLALNLADDDVPGIAHDGQGCYEHLESMTLGLLKFAAPDLDADEVARVRVESGEDLVYVIAHLRDERVRDIEILGNYESTGEWPDWYTADEIKSKRVELRRMREAITRIPA